ncbi:MAG TPA: MFS transporter [Candidatus Limnocylindrales bacterium]|nr:MFS transporter [Candidatus Limnocylindrales bacterium]
MSDADERRMEATPGDPPAGDENGGLNEESAAAVLRNRRFLALWLAQLATQVGANMVLFGLAVLISERTGSNSAVSLLILTFLVPAVVFGAVAGVYVDRYDRRLILVVTNLLRGVAFLLMVLVDDRLAFIYLLNVFVSTVTTFFAPAEAAMIPLLVDRRQLLAANGIYIFTLQAAFAVGFALLGPLVVNLTGVQALLVAVAVLYFVAAALCMVLPPAKPSVERGLTPQEAIGEAEAAVAGTLGQLREGIDYIRSNRSIFWSLSYLAITASLIGVLGVLGPGFARDALGLGPKDFVVVVLPLGFGLVMGILILNSYGRLLDRRRVIEGGLIGLAVALALLSAAGPISRFLTRASEGGAVDLGPIVSLLAVVVFLALLGGVAYGIVAVSAQTQLQEELPEDVRGRVFGVLNMLVSVASFLPILIVGPVADVVGTPVVIFFCALLVGLAGVGSILKAHPLISARAVPHTYGAPVDPVAVTSRPLERRRREAATLAPGAAADSEAAPTVTMEEPAPGSGPDAPLEPAKQEPTIFERIAGALAAASPPPEPSEPTGPSGAEPSAGPPADDTPRRFEIPAREAASRPESERPTEVIEHQPPPTEPDDERR